MKILGKILLGVAVAVALILLVYGAYQEQINNPDSPRYLGNGIIEITIDGHKYFKSGDILTHAESCPCKNQ